MPEETSPLDVVEAFAAAINAHDVEGIIELQSERHVFIDSLGSTVRGAKFLRKAWASYFEMVPDYCRSCLRAARENARSVREIISSEMWEQLNEFYLMVNSADAGSQADPQDLFRSVRMAGHLFTGVTNATMTHNEGWHFCRLGRMLERADKTSRILDVKYFLLLPTAADVGTTSDDIQWTAVLRSASAFEMYRKSHGRIAPDRIVHFLLFEREFPRAIQHCLVQAREAVHAISGTPVGVFRYPLERLLGELCSELAYARIEAIIAAGLHEYLDRLQTKMNLVGNAISETFFSARGTPPVRKKAKGQTAAGRSVG